MTEEANCVNSPHVYGLEFWSTNCDSLPVCRFIPYCSSDVWSGTGPAVTPAPRPRQGRQKEKVTNVNASTFFFSWILQDSKLSLPRLSENTVHLTFYVCFQSIWCVLLLSAEYTFMGSLIIREVIKDLIPKGIKQAKVVMLSGTRWVCFVSNTPMWTLSGQEPAPFAAPGSCPLPNIKREKPYYGVILLSIIKMFPVNPEQWHNNIGRHTPCKTPKPQNELMPSCLFDIPNQNCGLKTKILFFLAPL